ncbi:MAG: ABC transporter substrate-binding protein [Solirubrobacteraceae bacterium MAG38_C4-C5]|nr:ABC transporter substrate-binding protein [Candidatus Siliceabacter maunaloa]
MQTGLGTDLSALGAPVVGTVLPNRAGSTQADRYLADAQRVGSSDEPNLEAIAALRPDLVVTTSFEGEPDPLYEQYTRIAPTVAPELSGGWRENFLIVATVVGREADARRRIEEIDAALVEIRASLQRQGTPTVNAS